MQLVPTQPPLISDDKFHLRIGLYPTGCPGEKPPRKIDELLESGVELTLTELTTHGSVFYKNKVVKPRKGETFDDAMFRKHGRIWKIGIQTLRAMTL